VAIVTPHALMADRSVSYIGSLTPAALPWADAASRLAATGPG